MYLRQSELADLQCCWMGGFPITWPHVIPRFSDPLMKETLLPQVSALLERVIQLERAADKHFLPDWRNA